MRTLLYIPAHGQNIFFKKMLERLSALTERPAECIYTIDRPQPGEFEEAQSIYAEVAKVRDISFVSLILCVIYGSTVFAAVARFPMPPLFALLMMAMITFL